MKYFALLGFIAATLTSSLMGCEGGKSRPRLNCATGTHEDRGQCVPNAPQPPQCGVNETVVNNKCTKPTTNGCAAGFSLVNGNCTPTKEPGNGKSALTIEVVGQSACYVTTNGATRLLIQYVTRDENGRAIAPTSPPDLSTYLTVGGKNIDLESIIAQDSELLRSDLAISLLLDSSYSMTLHKPPAFEPMKRAAIDLLKNTSLAWKTSQSNFYWDVAWFNDHLFQPKTNNAGEAWTFDDLAYIPTPKEGTFTALFKAVDHRIKRHEKWYKQGIAAGLRDQQVLVVFSDGQDNTSSFNGPTSSIEGNYSGMLFWDEIALPAVPTVSAIIKPEKVVPNLRIFVLGMGDVNAEELKAIAALGHGQYFYGNSSQTLADLFEQVQRELVTQQTIGVETPLPAGKYAFGLHATRSSDNAAAVHKWTQEAGQTLPACTSK